MTIQSERQGMTRRQLLARSVAAGAAFIVGPNFIAGTDAAWAMETTALQPASMAWIVKAVGGTSIHWAGASLCFQEHEFKAHTTYGDVQGANLLDWPIDLAEMAPWYEKAETKLGVTRTDRCTGDTPGRLYRPGNERRKYLAFIEPRK